MHFSKMNWNTYIYVHVYVEKHIFVRSIHMLIKKHICSKSKGTMLQVCDRTFLFTCDGRWYLERQGECEHRRTEGGGDDPSPPPLLGHFDKDFTKTVDFSLYAPAGTVSM